MKAARLHAYHEPLKLDEVDEPKVTGPLDVVVRIGAAGLCRTDLHIQEGQWAEKSEVKLPYTPGHENAGWIHEVGSGVTNVEVGDTVIVHPFITCGLCRACRLGDDMHCENGSFPGINRDGGFADFLLTSARSVVKLDPSLAPADIAALADAGLTAIHAVKKAIPVLGAGSKVVVIGAGGLGHIGIQCLKAYTPTEIIVVDPSEPALELARELGADHTVKVDGTHIDTVQELTDGLGAQAIIDFVGEKGAVEDGVAMIEDGGFYYVIGYGQNIDIPTIDVISREISFIGNLVGTYVDLQDLMTLTAQGKVTLHTSTYPLDAINDAMADLDNGRLQGRGILVPAGVHGARRGVGGTRWASACTSTTRPAGCCRPASTSWPTPSRSRWARRAATSCSSASTGAPTITNDGVSIAREIELSDQFKNMGAQLVREVANKTSDLTGDGTTTATLLAQAIVREGMRALDEDVNPMLLRRGIEEATACVVAELQRTARPVEGREQPRPHRHHRRQGGRGHRRRRGRRPRSRRRRGRRHDRGVRHPRHRRRVRRGGARRERLDLALHGRATARAWRPSSRTPTSS